MNNTASANLNGTYNYSNADAQQPWGVVQNVNHRSGLCDVFFPHNPPEDRHGQVAIHELAAWKAGGVIEIVGDFS